MKVATRENTALSMVEEALEKAREYQDFNVFTSLNDEEALRKAAIIDAKIAKGEPVGRLAGVPYALKDNFLSRSGNTTASSRILEPFKSPITATAVEKLEAEGAILIGRTNLDAFAHGSSTENSYFGPTKNSVDDTRVAGGSSGGSAVAVALDIVQFATGTDTGGSIRQPASFNGVYGIKPTYGTISRYGVIAMASSLDVVGFFAKNPADLDLLMAITAGQDEKDMTTLPNFYGAGQTGPSQSLAEAAAERERPSPVKTGARDATQEGPVAQAPYKIGVVKDFRSSAVHPEVQQALDAKITELSKKGYEIVELDMPVLKYALAVYYIIQPAEVASNLSRYDGIRYGYRSEVAQTLSEVYQKSKSEGFMPENKRRIMIGNFVLSSGFYDAYYLKAQKARTLIIKEYEEAFKKCDFILTPVSPNPAFKLGEKVDDPVAMYLEDMMSVSINLAGIPALAIPAAETTEGLPIGLQLLGPRRSDQALIRFAEEL